jgi:DNA-directed RNA polymerase specialized sigma24 family protein
MIDREVLRLELWEGLSHSEIAMALAITADAARQRAFRARRHLAAEYDKLTRQTADAGRVGKEGIR